MNFFKGMDGLLGKVEKTGFKMANVTHKLFINGILVGIGYTIFSSLRDYNQV